MKARVRLTHTVELVVEGKDEDAIRDWMLFTTPGEAWDMLNGQVEEHYEEEIINYVADDMPVDYVIED